MSSIKAPSEALLRYFSEADGSRHVALILTRQQADEENIVAEGRYVTLPDRADTADIAFLVVDEMQRRGIATLLIQKLMEIAARNSIARFSADVLADNWAMVSLIRKTARSVSATVSSGVIHFDIPVIGNDRRMFRAA
jgi:GNAT superfamily N-acetyltransferase